MLQQVGKCSVALNHTSDLQGPLYGHAAYVQASLELARRHRFLFNANVHRNISSSLLDDLHLSPLGGRYLISEESCSKQVMNPSVVVHSPAPLQDQGVHDSVVSPVHYGAQVQNSSSRK